MKKNSKTALTAALALCMAVAMTACGMGGNSSSTSPSSVAPSVPPVSNEPSSLPVSEKTPEELAKLYEEAIIAARDEETNKYNSITTNANKSSLIEGYLAMAKENSTELTPADAESRYNQDLDMLTKMMGLTPDDMEAYALSTSLVNIKAYSVAIVKPAEGKTDAVVSALEGFVTAQQKAFETYLPDQGEIAKAAILKTLDDGTVVLVMSENAQAVYDSIAKSLAA